MSSLLEDKDEIRELMARYCMLFDTGAFEEWLTLFTDDGAFDVRGMGRFAGREQLRSFLRNVPLSNGQPLMRHYVMNQIIQVEGDHASARSYVLVARGGDRLELSVAGRYVDELRRVDRRWRFAQRTAHLDFMNR